MKRICPGRPAGILCALLFVLSCGRTEAEGASELRIQPPLKELFRNDFSFGCLLSYAHIGFPSDPPVRGQSRIAAPGGGELVSYHMNSMSPGNWMKPAYIVDIEASARNYADAVTADEKYYAETHPVVRFNGNITAQLNWARRQGFSFRGHTLVWHNQTPGTAFFRSGYGENRPYLDKAVMTDRMKNYIDEVFRIIHEGWPGLLTAMDVVNEAVNDNGTERSRSEWYRTFGDGSYVFRAFEFARQSSAHYGETQISLYYNDYNTHKPAKADGIVRLCGPIYKAGFLDGIGMQEHDALGSPTRQQWIASYDKFDRICSEMSVTELDVNPGNPPDYLRQADQYSMLITCFLERSSRSGRGKIVNVSKDGLNDQWAFVKGASLWDADNNPKPAFYAVVNAVERYYDDRP